MPILSEEQRGVWLGIARELTKRSGDIQQRKGNDNFFVMEHLLLLELANAILRTIGVEGADMWKETSKHEQGREGGERRW